MTASAGVPDRCPFILKQYATFISDICDSDSWKSYMKAVTDNPRDFVCLAFDHGTRHVKNTIKYAKAFLDELAESSLKDFLYGEECHSVERDKYLTSITGLLRYVGEHEFLSTDITNKIKIIENEFIDHSGLSEEDKSTIIDAICWWSQQDIFSERYQQDINQINVAKERFKVHRGILYLDTSIAIKMSLFLADMLDVGPDRITGSTYDIRGHERGIRPLAEAYKKIEKTEFRLTYNPNLGKINGFYPKNAAELHYTVEDGFDVGTLKLKPELILGPRSIAKDILGFRSFKFFVNDEEVNVNRFVKKQ